MDMIIENVEVAEFNINIENAFLNTNNLKII